MIVKYLDKETWGYIDNVRQVGNRNIDCDVLIAEYNGKDEYKDVVHSGEKDIAGYANGVKLCDDIAASNKVFLMATVDQDNWGHNVHTQNLIDGEMALENLPASVVLLYVEEHKEYDSIALVTNQKCFLMNDKGQTIERLV